MTSKGNDTNQQDIFIVAKGQHFLGRNDDEIRAFLLNRGVNSEQAQEVTERLMTQEGWRRGGASLGLILGGVLLAMISVVLIVGAKQQRLGHLMGLGSIGIVGALGCEISGIIGLAGLVRRRAANEA